MYPQCMDLLTHAWYLLDNIYCKCVHLPPALHFQLLNDVLLGTNVLAFSKVIAS